MICPIRELGFDSAESEETMECLEEECAWWIKPLFKYHLLEEDKVLDTAGCAIKKIAERIL